MVTYAARVKGEIAHWLASGLVDAPTAARLEADIESRLPERGTSFGSVLAILAGILLSASVLLLIAANWEAFPRLLRFAMLAALILGGYVAGAILKTRGSSAFAEAVWLIATAAFGAAMALTGQMYHLSGDEVGAILVWTLAAALAATLLRSSVLTVAGVLILQSWFWMQINILWGDKPFPILFVPLAALFWGISLWTRSAQTRHLIIVGLIVWLVMVEIQFGLVWPALLLVLAGGGLTVAGALAPDDTRRWLALGPSVMLDGIVAFWAGIAILQFQFVESGLSILLALVALAGFIGAVYLGGARSRTLRWLGYAGFTGEMIFLYTVTLGSMLGTAGLFLAAGLFLGLLAFVIVRIERRVMGGQAT